MKRRKVDAPHWNDKATRVAARRSITELSKRDTIALAEKPNEAQNRSRSGVRFLQHFWGQGEGRASHHGRSEKQVRRIFLRSILRWEKF